MAPTAWIADQVRNDKTKVRNDKTAVRDDKTEATHDNPQARHDSCSIMKRIKAKGVEVIVYERIEETGNPELA